MNIENLYTRFSTDSSVLKMQEVIFLKRITKVNLDLGISIDFVQDNQSFQRDATWFTLSKSSFSQTKLVRVLQGES
jgi:hypothetical protein